MKRLWFPVVMALVGVAVLCSLGVWQLQRMAQKDELLARIEARIGAEPTDIPALEALDPMADQYRPVTVTGTLGGEEAPVLTSLQGEGAGYRVVSAMTAGDRRILVDLGFAPEADKDRPRPAEQLDVTGNLLWPNEADSWTPPPDLQRNIWFARDLSAMAAALGTEPVLVVARSVEGADLGTIPVPVDTAGIPNDHYEYAVTWFGLALVWAVMSLVLVERVRRGVA